MVYSPYSSCSTHLFVDSLSLDNCILFSPNSTEVVTVLLSEYHCTQQCHLIKEMIMNYPYIYFSALYQPVSWLCRSNSQHGFFPEMCRCLRAVITAQQSYKFLCCNCLLPPETFLYFNRNFHFWLLPNLSYESTL